MRVAGRVCIGGHGPLDEVDELCYYLFIYYFIFKCRVARHGRQQRYCACYRYHV